MSTTLVLIRHAKRSPTFSGSDDLCPISPEGKKRTENLAHKLLKANIRPDKIFYSPTVRTKETAEVIQSLLPAPMEEVISLSLSGDETCLLPLIPSKGTIFMVGHGPTSESFAAHLIISGSIGIIMASSSALVLKFDSSPSFHSASFVQYVTGD